MNIGIYIYNDAEVLDFSGPYEVFSTASRISKDSKPFDVFMVGESGETVTARAGYRVIPDYGFHNHPEIDVLIIAGGLHSGEMENALAINWISEQAKRASIVASVCTGAFLLAQAGVLDAHRATTHWEDISDLQGMFPDLAVVEGVRWVDEGDILTSGGISAGIDMSLHLVGRLVSHELATRTAKQMEFSWTTNS